jgi:hypothetical protein
MMTSRVGARKRKQTRFQEGPWIGGEMMPAAGIFALAYRVHLGGSLAIGRDRF